MYFGSFYLDKEKDIIVSLERHREELRFVLSTPNHHTGNLIRNLARLCDLPLSRNEEGLLVIEGEIPSYVDGYNETVYVFRLGGTKVANIYPDGRIERKASIPALSKTLMSQTKDYRLDIGQTIIKSYIRSECKFRTDLHTHMNANLPPDILIALGIFHQIRYPLYYIKKLGLRVSARQMQFLTRQREEVSEQFGDSALTGKYLERKIDDNTFLNFADLILNGLEDASYNIPRIRASLAVIKDGQAVFTNLEKVYLYRYVFTKGLPSEERIPLRDIERIPDQDIFQVLHQIQEDHESAAYRDNSLFQDKLLWIARNYQKNGIVYAEITDTTLVKKEGAALMLEEVHRVMPQVTRETGVLLRFLAGIRRIPLTIVKDSIKPAGFLAENLRVLRAIAVDPYVAGSDIIGEEINDIRDIAPVLKEIVSIAADHPSFVVRVHAGENDNLRDNVFNSIRCVREALLPGQKMPYMRIGHGLYTPSLNTAKGRQLIRSITENRVVIEFQISSNVRLNNLSVADRHPIREYLEKGVLCVQGTDGGALYGTDSIDEELALEKFLSLKREELLAMRRTEEAIIDYSTSAFYTAYAIFRSTEGTWNVQGFFEDRIRKAMETISDLPLHSDTEESETAFAGQISEIPAELTPVILAGGSFNNDNHKTRPLAEGKLLIDKLLEKGDPGKICFVIGNRLTAYEEYLVRRNKEAFGGKFDIFAFVPSSVKKDTREKFRREPVRIRVAIEPSSVGLYKSISYEIFKRKPSILIAMDGNSAAINLMQEAKNAKYPCRLFVNPHSRSLQAKARTLSGYVTFLDDEEDMADRILKYAHA